VGVELFGAAGGPPSNNAVTSSLSVAPGATVVFGTVSPVAFVVDSTLGILGNGSARILATSKKLACTAFVADRLNAPPTSAWQLTVIAKTKTEGRQLTPLKLRRRTAARAADAPSRCGHRHPTREREGRGGNAAPMSSPSTEQLGPDRTADPRLVRPSEPEGDDDAE
jgi:hypothetical protein